MTRMRLAIPAALVVGTATVLGFVVLRHGTGGSRPAVPGRAPGASGEMAPVVGYLQMRDRRITMLAGGRYTVTSSDGKVLAEAVTLDQLKAVDPVLHEKLSQSVAGKKEGFGWAGREPTELAPGSFQYRMLPGR